MGFKYIAVYAAKTYVAMLPNVWNRSIEIAGNVCTEFKTTAVAIREILYAQHTYREFAPSQREALKPMA